MKTFIVTMVLMGIATHASAQECSAPIAGKVVKVYFANGMFTSPESAAGGVASLRRTFAAKFKESSPDTEFLWAQAYNENEKGLQQILEVVGQKVSDVATDGLTKAADFIRIKGGFMEEPSWYTDIRNKVATGADKVSYVLDSDLRKHVAMYRGDILAGRRVVVFAHSQGNFYTNAAYDLLYKGDNKISKSSFGMISVATPANRVADGGPYTTFREDLVINGVRLVFSDTLPGNTDFVPFDYAKYSGSVSDGFFDAAKKVVGKKLQWVVEKVKAIPSGLKAHNLSSYLSSQTSLDQLLSDGRNELGTLEAQEPKVSTGVVSVTLDWDQAGSDLDLYIVEPGDNTIYYGNVSGIGRLDRDVRNQAGPEHYYIACDSLEEGTYAIQAKYYSGEGSEHARVEVTADGSSRTFTHAFGAKQTTKDLPVTIAKLVIARNANGAWTYDIQTAE